MKSVPELAEFSLEVEMMSCFAALSYNPVLGIKLTKR